MKAAVIVPSWPQPTSGGRRMLHVLSKRLRHHGINAVTVGWPYPYEEIGDDVVPPDSFQSDVETVLIIPEGYDDGPCTPYYMRFVDQPHAAVVVYVQGFIGCTPRQPWETHYWSLGASTREIVRARMRIPEDMPIEEVIPPTDSEFWYPCGEKIPGSIVYSPRRNTAVLDRIGRRCGSKPVIRMEGASHEQMRELFDVADIFVLASEGEGISSIMCEAMSMECAVVTWPSGGLLDVIGHEKNGLLVMQGDVMGLEDCVKRLQKEPELARRLGKAARRTIIERFSPEQFDKQLLTAWANVETQI